MNQIPKKIIIISLGCSKNLVDSEQLHFHLQHQGYEVQHNPVKLKGDIAIVNTCGFINDAKEESVNVILELAEAKEKKQIKKLIVFGCLSQRYMDELKKEIPEVDYFIGNFCLEKLLKVVLDEAPVNPPYFRILDNPGHYAYLKIAEGCNRKCSFCAIPLIKGKYKSRSLESIVDEAEYLAQKGVKELMIIAQDTGYYGYDSSKTYLLTNLLKKLVDVNGIEWIRLHYLYPDTISNELIELIASENKICNYFDIPVQHISNQMLKRMLRNTKKSEIEQLIRNIRKSIRDVALRTTLLVGYPGETDSEFAELCRFIEEIKFDRLGAFAYSHEEDTWGGIHHSNNVPDELKQERLDTIMEIQRKISLNNNMQKIGKKMQVIIDRKENENFIGRTQYDSPDVDNEVIISAENIPEIGRFYEVEIIGAAEYEVFGKISK